ncbi:MAG: RnfABCDGE type electron transport complex subunit D [Bacteroidales bacterium]|nr:RnfABCDGE type electron transport complex subunit D [Bacteroidales bacterium]
MMAKLTVSLSPHFQSPVTTRVLMNDVLIALAPAVLVSLLFYGWNFFMLLMVSVATCIACEFVIENYLLGKDIPSISATCLTGVLLALNLPPAAPWWVAFLGSIAAIGIAKMCFGGLGQNIFNPAIFGRVFLLVSFPAVMTTWAAPAGWLGVDAFSGATPLAAINEGLRQGIPASQIIADNNLSGWHMLFARAGGSAGEISALALILGFVYLLVKKVIRPHIPLAILGTVVELTSIFSLINPDQFTGPLFNLFTGGLLLGAIFMATDYVTSPMAPLGMIIYGVLIGLLTVLIRYFGSYPEGVSFAILLGNMATPLINKYCKPRRFAA